MKAIDFATHERALAGRLAGFRQTLADLRGRLAKARGIVEDFAANPGKVLPAHAISAQDEADALRGLLEPLTADAERRESEVRDAYVAEHLDSLAGLLEADLAERVKARSFFRKTRARAIAKLVERIAGSDRLSPSGRLELDRRAQGLERELLDAEAGLQLATGAIANLRTERSFAALEAARGLVARVAFK